MSVVFAAVGLALVCLTAVHLLFPASGAHQALSTVPLIAHGFAFPLPGGAALVAVGSVMLVVALRRRRPRGRQGVPWVVAATSVVVSGLLLALAVTFVALPTPLRHDAGDDGASLVLVSWNALDHVDGAAARQIFGTLNADVAVLPELENRDGAPGAGSRIEEALVEGGLDPGEYDIFESPPTGTHIAPLTVIVAKEFGAYESLAVEQSTFGTVHLVPPAGSGLPEILAVHTAPPVPRWMAAWKTDLTRVRDFAREAGANTIIAGDLNATLRHGGVAGITSHADVLAAAPSTGRGTWPASAPQILRSSIDHVLIPANTHAVRDARVVDIPGSDHAAVVATISTPG